jgi:hypothetical protein
MDNRLRVLIVSIVAAFALLSCRWVEVGQPGQASYRATITVLNRTTAEVIVWSGEGGQVRFSVPACDEVTREDFPINFWNLTSPGQDSYHSGGGVKEEHSFLIVTSFVTQQDERPDPLPPCEGLLSSNDQAVG